MEHASSREEVLSFLGDDVCFYASDFPHEEVQGSELKRLQARTDVTPAALEGIVGANALRLYGPRLGAAAGAPGAARAAV